MAEPARSFATAVLSCSSARRTLASLTRSNCAAARASRNWFVVVSACSKRASMSEASAAVWVARAARISAPRRKPVKRSRLADRDVLTLRLLEFPLVSSPVTGSILAGPSEKKSLPEELAEILGRYAPQALRRWAAAVRTSAEARMTAGWTRSARRIASARVTAGCSGVCARHGVAMMAQGGSIDSTLALHSRKDADQARSLNDAVALKVSSGNVEPREMILQSVIGSRRYRSARRLNASLPGTQRQPRAQYRQDIGRDSRHCNQQDAERNENCAYRAEYRSPGVTRNRPEHQYRAAPPFTPASMIPPFGHFRDLMGQHGRKCGADPARTTQRAARHLPAASNISPELRFHRFCQRSILDQYVELVVSQKARGVEVA